MSISPLAGKPAPASMPVDIPKLVTAYYADQPDSAVVASGSRPGFRPRPISSSRRSRSSTGVFDTLDE